MTSTDLYIVRHWDGFDGEWIDVSKPMSREEAEQAAGDKNEAAGRPRDADYHHIDYYAAFPADTTMIFSQGRSQTRGWDD